MTSVELTRDAMELGWQIGMEIPPGLAGAMDFINAVKARSLYGMFTSAAEFFADFIPGGKLFHLLSRFPKLVKKVERLHKILEELAQIWE